MQLSVDYLSAYPLLPLHYLCSLLFYYKGICTRCVEVCDTYLIVLPVNCSIVKFGSYGHTHCIQCIKAANENKKFHYLNSMGVNGFGLKIKTCFSTTVKYFHAWSIHFFLGPHLLSPKLIRVGFPWVSLNFIAPDPKICCWRFRSASLRHKKGMLPALPQRWFRVVQCLLDCS